MNNFNEYGYDEGLVTLTLPEEGRKKWSDWKKETHEWRDHIEKHMDDKHDETQKHVTKETNRAIDEIDAKITTARNYIIDEVNSNTNNRANEIKSAISASKGVIDSIWNKVSSMTYYR